MQMSGGRGKHRGSLAEAGRDDDTSPAAIDPRRVERLYSKVISLAPREAESVLDRECGDSPELRAAVERLLAEDRSSPATKIVGPPIGSGPIQKQALIPDSARVGRYLVLRHMAAGGMGDIYIAYDESLDRKIAVKLLRPSQISEWSLRREAQALARLSHPNVVQVYDIGRYEEQPFVAMEFVNGVPLNQWLSAEPRSPEAILRMFIQCGRGLVVAHEAGLIHRDFKPANVVVGEDGRPRVLDFGIVSGPSIDPEPARLDDLMAGTPQYMAPEQISGAPATAATDQFGFAVALYRALYGQAPFGGDGVVAMQANVLLGAVQPPPPGKAPDWVAPIVLRALSHDASARHASLADMLGEIERRLPRDSDLDPNVGRTARLALAFAIVVVAATILVIAQLRGGFAHITRREFMVVPSAVFSLTAAAVIVFRKRLLANRYGAQMSGLMLVVGATLIVHRLVAFYLGQSIPQILVVDMLALGAEFALASFLLVRWFAACAGLMFLGSMAAMLFPHWATPAMIVASFSSLAIGLLGTQKD